MPVAEQGASRRIASTGAPGSHERISPWTISAECPVRSILARSRSSLLALASTATTSQPAAASCIVLRSEEHTSELQSLMRISYAVFCLKKKKKYKHKY